MNQKIIQVFNKYSVEQLVDIYFSISGKYETCTSFSAFMAICHKLFHSESEKFQYMWQSLTDENKKKMDIVKYKINKIIDERYYNKDKVFSDVRRYNKQKDYLTIDMGILNILNKLYNDKFGIQKDLVCDLNIITRWDCEYLHKHNIQTKKDLLNTVRKEAFDGNKVYFLNNSRLLPTFSENPNVRYKDILDNVWPLIPSGNHKVNGFEFFGWKNGIPILKII